MIVFCSSCFSAVRIVGSALLTGEASEYWPDKYTCHVCKQDAQGTQEANVSADVLQKMHFQDMTDVEYYAVLNGMGPPEDRVCKKDFVRNLLLTQKVVAVVGFEPSGTDRFVIDHLVFEGGDKMYLGASPSGAVVYRISKKVEYAHRILEGCDGSSC